MNWNLLDDARTVQKPYERSLLPFYVWFYYGCIDSREFTDRIICRDEVLPCEVFPLVGTFGPRFPAFYENAASDERSTVSDACNRGE